MGVVAEVPDDPEKEISFAGIFLNPSENAASFSVPRTNSSAVVGRLNVIFHIVWDILCPTSAIRIKGLHQPRF